jgi:hypothetical protein
MKFAIMIAFISISCFSKSNEYLRSEIEKKIGSFTHLEKVKIKDTISENPVNNELIKVLKVNKTIGFVRAISTTTGCNSACLPINYISFYAPDGSFLSLSSKDGLTKINHTPFTKEDYSNLEFILSTNTDVFKDVDHPKEMTDAISGETLKLYRHSVVKGAAYSTLRIHLYNQDTIKYIKSLSHSK